MFVPAQKLLYDVVYISNKHLPILLLLFILPYILVTKWSDNNNLRGSDSERGSNNSDKQASRKKIVTPKRRPKS